MPKELRVTTGAFIDGLVDFVQKLHETLLAAREFVASNEDIESDGGEPFLVEDGCHEAVDDELFNHDDSLGHALDERVAGPDDGSKPVVEGPPIKRKRAKITRRTTVTDEMKVQILAELDQEPRPRMKDVADKYLVSQSTVSRLAREYPRRGDLVPDATRAAGLPEDDDDVRLRRGSPTDRTLHESYPMDRSDWERRPVVPLPGQKELPVL